MSEGGVVAVSGLVGVSACMTVACLPDLRDPLPRARSLTADLSLPLARASQPRESIQVDKRIHCLCSCCECMHSCWRMMGLSSRVQLSNKRLNGGEGEGLQGGKGVAASEGEDKAVGPA